MLEDQLEFGEERLAREDKYLLDINRRGSSDLVAGPASASSKGSIPLEGKRTKQKSKRQPRLRMTYVYPA